MDAGACCFAIRRWGGSTSTIRRTHISRRANCIWARSAWSARARARRLWRCGRRRDCCRLCRAVNSRRGWRRAGARRWSWTGECAAMSGLWRWPPASPELDIVVWALRAADFEEASERAQKVFDACALRGLHLALVQLPRSCFRNGFGFEGAAEKKNDTVTCLRSVLMKPEHEAWMGEIWDRLSGACDEVLVGEKFDLKSGPVGPRKKTLSTSSLVRSGLVLVRSRLTRRSGRDLWHRRALRA